MVITTKGNGVRVSSYKEKLCVGRWYKVVGGSL